MDYAKRTKTLVSGFVLSLLLTGCQTSRQVPHPFTRMFMTSDVLSAEQQNEASVRRHDMTSEIEIAAAE